MFEVSQLSLTQFIKIYIWVKVSNLVEVCIGLYVKDTCVAFRYTDIT